MSNDIGLVRNLFLRFICLIYTFAFASLYIQIPGLYGENGILPARIELSSDETDFSLKLQKKPTLLWFAQYLSLNAEYMMEFLSLIGIFLGFTGFISQKFCIKVVFAGLWSLYYSLFQVGQTFLWFQWDILLLETGFLCIIVAPGFYRKIAKGKGNQPVQTSSPSDSIRFWLVRWLAFRLLFSSGVVKLTSGCPSWWSLTALKIHFESQCLPTPLAWYAHHLPSWFLKLNTALSFVVEIAIPLLFFFPLCVRRVAFWIQVFFQIGIILTGNYTFFNILTIALCLSLVDDSLIAASQKPSSNFMTKLLKFLFTVSVYAGVGYATYVLFGIKILPGGIVESKITFTREQFDYVLSRALHVVLISVPLLSLLYTCLKALYQITSENTSFIRKLGSLLSSGFYSIIAITLFVDSLVPFAVRLDPKIKDIIPPEVQIWNSKLSHLHLTNSYGLFRRMTGVNGRPEVILEGANSDKGPWLEYDFRYKPGHVNKSLPFVAPHQPRLDWQMWFAALGAYHQNPWLLSLTYRLLRGQQEVLDLIGPQGNPFPQSPPKFIRASLYHYHYTVRSRTGTQQIWTRQRVADYFPAFSLNNADLIDYLKKSKIISTDKRPQESPNPNAVKYLNILRKIYLSWTPEMLMLSLFITGLVIIKLTAGSSQVASSASSTSQPVSQTKQQKKKQKKHNH